MMKKLFRHQARLQRLSLRALAALGVYFAAILADGAPAATPAASLDYSSFRIISDRNIFNSRRYARAPGQTTRRPTTTRRPSASRTDSIALVGTMSYYKGPFAFFEGTSASYRKAAQRADTIGGLTVLDIQPNFVRLLGTNMVPEGSHAAATNHIAVTNVAAATGVMADTNLVAGTNVVAGTNLVADAAASAATNAATAAEEQIPVNTNLVAVPYIIELAVGMQVRRDEEGVWKLAGAAEHYTVSSGASPLFGRTPQRESPSGPAAPAVEGGEAPTVIVIDPTTQEATTVDTMAPEGAAPPPNGDAAAAPAAAPAAPAGGGEADAVMRRLMERAAAERGGQ